MALAHDFFLVHHIACELHGKHKHGLSAVETWQCGLFTPLRPAGRFLDNIGENIREDIRATVSLLVFFFFFFTYLDYGGALSYPVPAIPARKAGSMAAPSPPDKPIH